MPDTVESKVLSHPDTVDDVQVKLETPPETPPPPAPKKLKPCPVEWMPPIDLTKEPPPCCIEDSPALGISEMMVRDLSYALLGSFLLGAITAGSIAFFSRRVSTDA